MNEFTKNVGLLQAVTCILGLEQDEGLTRLAEELSVAVNPWSGDSPEFAICRQHHFFFYRHSIGVGGAGNRSIIQLHNDSVSDLVVLEPGCRFTATAPAVSVLIARTSTLATTDAGLVAFARDGRYPRPTVPSVRARSQNGVALPAGFSNGIVWDTFNSLTYELAWPTILRPGGTIAIFPDVDNAAVQAAWVGRVWRTISQRELSP